MKPRKGYSALYDIFGKPAVGISIAMEREVMAIGLKGIQNVIIAMVLVSIVFTMFILIFFDRKVLKRLKGLSKDVRKIGDNQEMSFRLKVEAQNDEIGVVSQEINDMLFKLEQSQHQVKESENNLKHANDSWSKGQGKDRGTDKG
jgi:signal transduction histidine kinase